MKNFLIQHYAILALLLLSAVLLLANLGNQYLWQDEAQTALISQTVLDRGMPYGTDGVNYFSQELGAEYGENYVWKWHTWLPFYIQAFFFWLFGTSNFIARLPFALFGAGAVWYTYRLARRLFDERTALIAVALLATNVAFLLLARQSRLYSPAIFFSTAGIYYFLMMLEQQRKAALGFIVCATGLFHTHYVYFATMLAALGLYVLLLERSRFWSLISPMIIAGVINVPWIIWFRDLKYNHQYQFNLTPDSFSSFFWSYASSVKEHILGGSSFYLVFLICLVAMVHQRNKMEWKSRSLVLLTLLVAVNMVVLSAFTPGPMFRYLSVLLPIGILFLAYAIRSTMHWHRGVPIVLVAFMIYFSPIHRYAYEITHDYDGPLEGICNYLHANAAPSDTVLITYGDLPVKWYTHLRTYGGLTGEDISVIKNPDWVIDRKYMVCDKDQKIKEFIRDEIDLSRYEKIEIPYPDYMFENREQVDRRIFYPQEEDMVVLYVKRKSH